MINNLRKWFGYDAKAGCTFPINLNNPLDNANVSGMYALTYYPPTENANGIFRIQDGDAPEDSTTFEISNEVLNGFINFKVYEDKSILFIFKNMLVLFHKGITEDLHIFYKDHGLMPYISLKASLYFSLLKHETGKDYFLIGEGLEVKA